MLLIVGAASVGLAVELDPDMINVSYTVATLFFFIFLPYYQLRLLVDFIS